MIELQRQLEDVSLSLSRPDWGWSYRLRAGDGRGRGSGVVGVEVAGVSVGRDAGIRFQDEELTRTIT